MAVISNARLGFVPSSDQFAPRNINYFGAGSFFKVQSHVNHMDTLIQRAIPVDFVFCGAPGTSDK